MKRRVESCFVNQQFVSAVPDPDLISILMPILIRIHNTVFHPIITARVRCSIVSDPYSFDPDPEF
jgi:hypothetical protein